MRSKALLLSKAIIAAAAALGGCRISDPTRVAPATPTPPQPKNLQVADVPAGVPVAVGPPQLLTAVVASRKFPSRPDPFALQQIERGFEAKQEALRIFGQTGGFFPSMFTAEPETVEVETVEPQPYRRLAGILVGDSVLAIIDMGGGQMHVIRPGQPIPNSEWMVVSIDEEKAVLRRGGNKKPKEIVVRLESPAFRP